MAARVLGRHPDCDIVVSDPTVSRRHAEISEAGPGRYLLTDLGSTSGTFRWDGGAWVRVTRAEVGADDRVRFGAHACSMGELVSAGGPGRGPVLPPRVERDPATGQIVTRPR